MENHNLSFDGIKEILEGATRRMNVYPNRVEYRREYGVRLPEDHLKNVREIAQTVLRFIKENDVAPYAIASTYELPLICAAIFFHNGNTDEAKDLVVNIAEVMGVMEPSPNLRWTTTAKGIQGHAGSDYGYQFCLKFAKLFDSGWDNKDNGTQDFLLDLMNVSTARLGENPTQGSPSPFLLTLVRMHEEFGEMYNGYDTAIEQAKILKNLVRETASERRSRAAQQKAAAAKARERSRA